MATNSERLVNVLFTSAGRRVELLRAFRNAYQTLGLSGQIIATDIDPLAPALQLSDKAYIVPRVAAPEYIPKLAEICRRHSVDLVFPLIDPDIPVLAAHRSELEMTGARVVAMSPEAVKITRDKWLTSLFFAQLGVNIPRSWLPDQIPEDELTYPVFIKPRSGSAGQSAFRVNNGRELAFFTEYVPNALIQEFLSGPEITSDVTCDLAGTLLAIVSRRRIEVRSGEVAKGVTVYDPIVTDACQRIARALPAVGPITVQCILRDGVPYFTEINARLGGGLPLGIAAGVDSPKWFLAMAAGIPMDLPRLGSYEEGLYLTRFDESFFLTESQLEQTASRHI